MEKKIFVLLHPFRVFIVVEKKDCYNYYNIIRYINIIYIYIMYSLLCPIEHIHFLKKQKPTKKTK